MTFLAPSLQLLRKPIWEKSGHWEHFADAYENAIPSVALVGDREVEDRSVAIREGDSQRVVPLAEAIEGLSERAAPPV